MRRLDVSTPMRRAPCAFAERVRRGGALVEDVVVVVVVGERASLVKRSEMAFSWRRGGSMMWTSGWGHWGSWMESTVEAARTMTGMSCVIVVSRSWG